MNRSLIRHTPFNRPLIGAFEPLFGKAILDDFFASARGITGHDGAAAEGLAWWPAADIAKTDDAWTLIVDLPGLTTDDIDLTIEDKVLTLSGERRARHDGVTADRIERVHGRFRRSFNLPGDADAGAVVARFENGVLHITIPKAEAARARKIEIA